MNRRWVLESAGCLSNLKLIKEPIDRHCLHEGGPNWIRVEVKAVGLNFADVFACLGLYSATPKGSFTPGLEFAGIIREIGKPKTSTSTTSTPFKDSKSPAEISISSAVEVDLEGGEREREREREEEVVHGFRVGDRVMGLTRFGAFASQVIVHSHYLKRLPDNWSFQQGAAFLAQALTAWYGLVEQGGLRPGVPGRRILLQSAAGGVGLMAMHIASIFKAHVVPIVGSEKKRDWLAKKFSIDPNTIVVRTSPSSFVQQAEQSLETVLKIERERERERERETPHTPGETRGERERERPFDSRASANSVLRFSDDENLRKLAENDRLRFDIVFDAVAGDYFDLCYKSLLSRGGRYILYGAASYMSNCSDRPNWITLAYRYLFHSPARVDPMSMIHLNQGVVGFNLIWLWDRWELFHRMFEEMLEYRWKPPTLSRVYPFEQALDALRFLQSGQNIGKVVLDLESRSMQEKYQIKMPVDETVVPDRL